MPAQIAGVDHLAPHGIGQVDARQRFADLRQTVDPDFVIEFAQGRMGLFALPFRLQSLRIVHHVAQSQDHARAMRAQHLQCRPNFAAEA